MGSMKLWVGPLAGLLAVAAATTVQDRFANVQIKTTHVAGTVHMLEGEGGNIGVCAGEDGLLMVDDQYAPLAARIKAALDALGKGDLQYLVNTHHHGDHTGGNAFFGKGVPVIAHDNVLKRLKMPDRQGNTMVRDGLPKITYDDDVSLHVNGEKIRLVHYPACHTDGDTVVMFETSNVVHMGDMFFVGRFPYVDLASGGDVESFIEAITELAESLPEDVKIIPGHGPLAGIAELREYLAMMEETVGLVRTAIEAGKTKKQIQASGLPPKYKGWGSGFIPEQRWIDIVFESLDADG